MLNEIVIILKEKIIFRQKLARGPEEGAFAYILEYLNKEIYSKFGNETGSFDYFLYKVSYIVEKQKELLFIFITGLTDDFNRIKKELIKFKGAFLNDFVDIIEEEIDVNIFDILKPLVNNVHKNLKPKISIVGFSGVGKTTIIRLIKAEELPMEHIPTITGDISTIKIGNLYFYLWDFAGQDQFNFLWQKFIRGSDAVLLITDSTMENVEKSKYFLTLIHDEVPQANAAAIANKQDQLNAMKTSEIESVLGLKTYSMVAIDPENRIKMIQIIADLLDISAEVSPLLAPIFERDNLISESQKALRRNDFVSTIQMFEKISDICINLGDDSLAKEFYDKAEIIKKIITKQQT